jgi:hypothetical protein
VRSHLLSHWTGKDLATEVGGLTGSIRSAYVDRLLDILRNGLWMTVPAERLQGRGESGGTRRIQYEVPMLCFTELRASQSQSHRGSYGLLGVVVDRHFVLRRAGGPVLYVRNHPDDGVVGNLARTFEWLNEQVDAGVQGARDVRDSLPYPVAFLKAMSEAGVDDYRYIDEFEWRIVHTHQQQAAGRIVPTGQARPKYRVPITIEDLKMVIVPDSEVRDRAVETIQRWSSGRVPPVLTIDEVEQM